MKPKNAEKGCWNCYYGDISLKEGENKRCVRCLTTGKKRWKSIQNRPKNNKKGGVVL